MKKTLFARVSFLMFLLSPSVVQAEHEEGLSATSMPKLQLVGRFISAGSAYACSLPGSKVGLRFTGTSLSARIADSGDDALNVSIDGGPAVTLSLKRFATPQNYILAAGLDDTEHVVWLSKRTETFTRDQQDSSKHCGQITFAGFGIDQGHHFLAPPPLKKRLIEAIGDSGFAAYAVEQPEPDPAKPCGYSVSTQNADLSLPAFVAKNLDADLINISVSGAGIYDSPWEKKRRVRTLLAMYESTLGDSKHSQRTADVVLIDGGANDIFGDQGKGFFPDRKGYIHAYVKLISLARRKNPRAKIFCIASAGVGGQDRLLLKQAISEVVSYVHGKGDKEVFAVDYFAGEPHGWQTIHEANRTLKLGATCLRHRSPQAAAYLAGRLVAQIRAKGVW